MASNVRNSAINKVAELTSVATEKVAEYFDYLDNLKDSGDSKMFGSISFLMKYDTKLTRQQACIISLEWVESYGK